MKASTAIIGLGKIGLTYDLDKFGVAVPNKIMTHCRAVSTSDFFKISYLIDPRIEAVRLAVHHYGGIGFQSITEAAGQEPPQLVIVSVPTPLHVEMLLSITKEWSPRAYLMEKPFGSSAHEARLMRDALERQGTKVYVNYLRRYLPNVISLKSSPSFKKRGRLLSVNISAYSSLENIFSHFLDLLIFLECPSILGISQKVNHSPEIGTIKFEDQESGILFEFGGIGHGQRVCEMLLVYDSAVVKMTSNGRYLEILDTQKGAISIFNIDNSTFDSYQAIILKRIATEFESPEMNTCVADAIRIHEFIESI